MRAKCGAALTILAIVSLPLTGCRAANQSGGSADIVVGADLDLSGAQAAVGTAYQRALQLEIDKLNAGGALGARRLRLVVRDNQAEPNVSAVNVSELTQDPNLVGIVAGPCAQCVVASSKTINSRRVPTVALTGANEVITPVSEQRYLFRLGPNVTDDAATLASALSGNGVRRFSLVTVNDLYGRAAQSAMPEEARKAGLTLVNQATLDPAGLISVTPLQKVIDDRSDALVIWAYPAQASQVAVTVRSNGYRGQLYFDATAAGDLFLPAAAAPASDGATLIFPQVLGIDDLIATTPAKADRRQWFSDYTARYGGFHAQAPFAADAVRMIVNAVVASRRPGDDGNIDRSRVRDLLETAQLDGLSGSLRFTPINHSALGPQAMTTLVARNGRWRLSGTGLGSAGGA